MNTFTNTAVKLQLTILLTVLLIIFGLTPNLSAEDKFNPAPIFSIPIGTDSPEKIGQWVDEEKIKNYDYFYFPASFITFEKLNFILILDSAKNRVCKYSLTGQFEGDFKIPFKERAVDIAYSADLKRLFTVFQDSCKIGECQIDFKVKPLVAKSSKLIELPDQFKDITNSIQKIWLFNNDNSNEIFLGANVNSKIKNAVFAYANEKLTYIKVDDAIKNAVFACSNQSATDILLTPKSARFIVFDFKTKNVEWFDLLKEFIPKVGGFCCRSVQPAGSDLKNNYYVKALYGHSEDKISKAYIYRFNKNGRFTGRGEVFISPAMLTNRFITIDNTGNIYYMKKNEKDKKIEFYKFEINELN
ncbi:MAG: hypothetical protein QMC67_03230 [Candidatus Wallbacteria bacterium]